jgi:hypothetical protein
LAACKKHHRDRHLHQELAVALVARIGKEKERANTTTGKHSGGGGRGRERERDHGSDVSGGMLCGTHTRSKGATSVLSHTHARSRHATDAPQRDRLDRARACIESELRRTCLFGA